MKTKCREVWPLLVLTLTAVFAGGLGARYDDAPAVRVKLEVSAEDILRSRLEHCLEKNLEEFEDLSVVEKDEDWTLAVIAVKTPMRGGIPQDYVFSLVIHETVDGEGPVMRGHDLLVGHPNVQGGCKAAAIRFAERYLRKDAGGVIDRY